jgi:outer membrane protein assembly factor BamB
LRILPTEPLWSVELSAAPLFESILTAGLIITPLRTGSIMARDADTGADVWTFDNLSAEQPLTFDDDRVYVAAGEAIRALHAKSGEVAWVAPTGTLTAPPIARGGWVIAPSIGGKVTALRASDGTRMWTMDTRPVAQRPDIDGDTLILPLADGDIVAVRLTDGRALWTRKLGSLPGPPLIIGGRVFVGTDDKQFYALDASNGEIEWVFRVGAVVRGRAAVDDDHVYVAALDNVLRALDRGDGAREWFKGLKYRPTAGPIVIGNDVLVPGSAETLPVFTAKDGALVAQVTFGAPLGVPPLFYQSHPYDRRAVVSTGTLEGPWKLTTLVPGLPQGPAVTPITTVPGLTIVLPTEWPPR